MIRHDNAIGIFKFIKDLKLNKVEFPQRYKKAHLLPSKIYAAEVKQ